MRCTAAVQMTAKGGNAGMEYVYVCECGTTVTVEDDYRLVFVGLISLLGLPFALFLFGAGVKMLADTLTRGTGGNDAGAVWLVIVVFLGLGGLVGWLMLASTWSRIQNRRRWGRMRERRATLMAAQGR